MPTHENMHYMGAASFGGGLLVVPFEMCWQGVGLPETGIFEGTFSFVELSAILPRN